MSTTAIRQAAVAAYLAAAASPASADWRRVAETLFTVLPASAKAPAASDVPYWWSDWALPRHYQLDSMEVTFSDGETVRCNLAKAKGKLPRIATACRVAIAFYRARTGNEAVPALVLVQDLATGAHFDAAECSRMTAELRAVPGTVQGKPMTLDGIAWMERELERRRAIVPHRDASAESIAEAVKAGERELARMRAAYRAQRQCEAVTAAPIVAVPLDAEACADALAPFYGEPAEFAHAGTFDADAGTMSAFAPSIVVGKIDTLISGATIVEANLIVSPVEAIPLAPPVEAIASEPVAATETEISPDLSTEDDWQPTAESHPIIALALSEKARAAIFARVMDGTFHDSGERVAKCGAWRLTLADAEALQDVGSVRFVGMPRKAYTRRLAPVVAAPEPIVIPADAVPCAAPVSYPGSIRPDCAVVLHAPSM